MGDESGPGAALLAYIDDRVQPPFSYLDLKHRYNPDIDNLQNVFAGLKQGGHVIEETYAAGSDDRFDGEDMLQETFTALWRYLNETDGWYQSSSFRIGQGRSDFAATPNLQTYAENIPGFEIGDRDVGSDTVDALAEKGAISDRGGIAYITDLGWRTIYATASQNDQEPIYRRTSADGA